MEMRIVAYIGPDNPLFVLVQHKLLRNRKEVLLGLHPPTDLLEWPQILLESSSSLCPNIFFGSKKSEVSKEFKIDTSIEMDMVFTLR